VGDRVADQFQQVCFDVTGGPTANGYRSDDLAQPRQQHPGHADDPPAALLRGQVNQLFEDGALEVAGRRGMLEQHAQLNEGNPTRR